jgi:hypothetical protein
MLGTFLVNGYGDGSSSMFGVESPVGMNAHSLVTDADEGSGRNGPNLAIGCQIGVRKHRQKTRNIFVAQTEGAILVAAIFDAYFSVFT